MKKLQQIFKNGDIQVSSPEAMRALGRRIATLLEAGDVIGLVGDLGAGKTHLTQGILEGLGADEPAASPTFSLAHEHQGGRLPAVHFDFYRMESPEEALSIGWDEFLDRGDVLIIEWADRFDGGLLPPETIWLVLSHRGEHERTVRLAR